MSEQAKNIRNAIRNTLEGETSAGDNVFAHRIADIDVNDLPAIQIENLGESISEYSKGPKIFERHMNLIIEIQVSEQTDQEAADMLDDIGEQIEQVIAQDETLACLCDFMRPTGYKNSFGNKAERPTHIRVLEYDVAYTTEYPKHIEDTAPLEIVNTKVFLPDATDPDEVMNESEITLGS